LIGLLAAGLDRLKEIFPWDNNRPFANALQRLDSAPAFHLGTQEYYP
jgi:hypothetical protein